MLSCLHDQLIHETEKAVFLQLYRHLLDPACCALFEEATKWDLRIEKPPGTRANVAVVNFWAVFEKGAKATHGIKQPNTYVIIAAAKAPHDQPSHLTKSVS